MKRSKRTIFIIIILVICIVVINIAVYFHITEKPNNNQEQTTDSAALIEDFNNIFDNQIDYQNNNISISKEDDTKEFVYTSYTNQDKLDNSYELNINIPYININSETAKRINNEINSLFYDKAISIISGINQNTVYIVNYKAYVNDNILSLIISSTLKEGQNAQRVIMKTYNYNLLSNTEMTINEVLQYRGVTNKHVQSKINETIQKASDIANQYKQLGYNMYLRNVNDNMYKVENTKVYFIGKDKAIYIIYPYGNSKYTSEVDLLVI